MRPLLFVRGRGFDFDQSGVTGPIEAQRFTAHHATVMQNDLHRQSGSLRDVGGSQHIAVARDDDAAALRLADLQADGAGSDFRRDFPLPLFHGPQFIERARRRAAEDRVDIGRDRRRRGFFGAHGRRRGPCQNERQAAGRTEILPPSSHRVLLRHLRRAGPDRSATPCSSDYPSIIGARGAGRQIVLGRRPPDWPPSAAARSGPLS
jgi:hypothetical protein